MFTKVERAMLFLTGTITLVLGSIAYVSVFNPPDELTNSTNVNSSVRGPASYITEKGDNDKNKSIDKSMFSLDLKCLNHKESHTFNSQAKMLQIKAKLCVDQELDKVEILNRTNGSKASVFHLKNNHFMTDYLSLAPGNNQLIIQLTTTQGESVLNNLVVEYKPTIAK
ncbi:MAG: hypothetical protein KDD58_02335 [Bdellovibrionales bacterium]|nr:hypothetical protein [Bdellovibrionales bacterium]